MKSNGIVRVAYEPGDPPPVTMTDEELRAVAAMTEEEVHAAALSDPDAQPLPADLKGLHRVVNVRHLRERLGMTQEQFSLAYRIPLGILRDWEQGRKRPDATARAYLLVIEGDPQGVARTLRAA